MHPLWNRLRSGVGRGALLATIVAAGLGFVGLAHGKGYGASGTAAAYGEAIHYSIAPLALGRIDHVDIHVGQHVKLGDPIAHMDNRDLNAARDKAVAMLAELEAAVTASTQDEEFQVTRSELWVLKARADEHGDRAQLEEVTQRMNRLDELLKAQMIPASQAEAARQAQHALEARVETYDQAKHRGQAGLDQTGAGNHDHASAVDLHVEPARQAVEVQRAAIRAIDLQIEQLTLRAPADAIVTMQMHWAGDVVPAGTPVLTLVGMRPNVIIAELPETMAMRAHVGQGVTARTKDVFASGRRGHIIELAPEVDEVAIRARPSPSIPAFGRRAAIELDAGGEVLPGEAFGVVLD